MPYPNDAADAPLPTHLKRWNWGAFWLNWIWGLTHNTFIALLVFIPIVNIVMIFVLGAKGNQWAWKNNIWRDEAHFRKTQRYWAIAGWLILPILALISFLIFYGIVSVFKSSEAFKLSVKAAQENAEVIRVFGQPLTTGFIPTGSVNINGPSGRASLAIPLSGPNCTGTLYTRGIKQDGRWRFQLIYITPDCQADPIEIINETGRRLPGRQGTDI